MSQLSYHEQVDRENILRLRNLIKDLPPFCGDFFRGIEPRTSSRTRIAYAYDLHVFFDFLHKENPALALSLIHIWVHPLCWLPRK